MLYLFTQHKTLTITAIFHQETRTRTQLPVILCNAPQKPLAMMHESNTGTIQNKLKAAFRTKYLIILNVAALAFGNFNFL